MVLYVSGCFVIIAVLIVFLAKDLSARSRKTILFCLVICAVLGLLAVKRLESKHVSLTAEMYATYSAKKFEESLEIALTRLAIAEFLKGKKSLDYARGIHDIAYVLKGWGYCKSALVYFDQAVEIFESLEGSDGFNVALTLDNKALCLENDKDIKQAIELGKRSYAIKSKLNSPYAATTKVNLIRRMAKAKMCAEAVAESEPLVQFKSEGLRYVSIHDAYANALACAGREQDAIKVYEDVIPAAIENDSGEYSYDLPVSDYIKLLIKLNQVELAERRLEEYYTVCSKKYPNDKARCSALKSLQIRPVAYRLSNKVSEPEKALLKKIVDAERWKEREVALEQLLVSGDPNIVPLLEVALQNDYYRFRAISVRRLPYIISAPTSTNLQKLAVPNADAQRIYDKVLDVFLYDEYDEVRAAALWAMVTSGFGLDKIQFATASEYLKKISYYYRDDGAEIFALSPNPEISELAKKYLEQKTDKPWSLETFEFGGVKSVFRILMM